MNSFRDVDYVYVVYYNDELELPMFVSSKLEDVANYLGITFTAVSKMVSRKVSYFVNSLRVEKVLVSDYVYVVYRDCIEHPIYVVRTINDLSSILGMSFNSLYSLYFRSFGSIYSTDVLSLNEYNIVRVDLLDLDFDLYDILIDCYNKSLIKLNSFK